nr:hypothetical protein [Tanacetum cinerariifolium]
MDTTIEHQLAMDEALVPTAQRLKIGRSNLCLLSDIKSKESTLQLVYDVLRRCSFFKAFLVTADVPEIYMQEFLATTTIHYHSIRCKMDNKKHIIDLESFRDILHICLRVYGQPFAEPSFEEEILAFIHFLGNSAAIKKLTDVNINKLYQPWRSFAALINKCLTEKSSGYDSLRLSQAQILHQNTQQFGDLLPIELTNDEIRNSKAYKEYYVIATGEAAHKPKASVRRNKSSSDTSITPPTAAISADEGTGSKPGVPDVLTDESEEELSWNSTDEEGNDNEEKDDDGDEEDLGLNINEEERHIEEEEEDKLYRDVNINQARGLQASLEVEDSHVTLTPVNPDGQQESSSVSSQFMTSMLNPTLDRMTEADKIAIQIQSDRLQDEAQRENVKFLRTVDENMKKIIKEQVKEQVKAQASKILPRIKQALNEQLEAEVLTLSSHSSRTSYAVAADLFEMELKKILIEKMEGNKSIQCSAKKRNLYKALVDAYESDKLILDTYGETATLKRRRDDNADKDEEPSAGPDQGSKRRREGKEPESASAPTETAIRSADRVDTLTPELLVGPTYDLMKGSCKSLIEL